MHWLAGEVERLVELSETLTRQGRGDATSAGGTGARRAPGAGGVADGGGTVPATEKVRAQFLAAVRNVVQDVARRSGVTACFACHDGLVLAGSGRGVDFEALSAMSQACLTVGKDAASALSLGRVQQLVLIGSEHKLAVLAVGQLSMGILSPRDVELGTALAR